MLLVAAVLLFSRAASAEVAADDEGYYCYGDGHLHTSQPCRFFAIVIDAGSTGTRLQLYRFVHSTLPRGLPFHAEEETFHEVKPGLSSFFDQPELAAASVEELLKTASRVVPEKLRGRTPIVMKATAGLRLLPGDAAHRILEKVNASVRASGFVCMENCVGILDGNEEGVFSWFTLNLLLVRFYHDSAGNEVDPSPGRSAAAFDLGGGSTQVTFWPQSDAIFDAHPDFRHDIDFFQTHMHLYTHSYLGAGLQSARLGILQGEEREVEGVLELESPCFPPDFQLPKWEQALKEWSVRGTADYSLQACQKTIRDFVRRSNIGQLTDLRGSSHLYFFSYFYDRARQAGLVKDGEAAKPVKVVEWRDAAEKACSTPSFDVDAPHWLPWQCLDFTYIHALLKDGYGLDDHQEIIPVNSIKGMGVSWALGMAYSLVDEFHRELALEDIDDGDQRSSVNATGVELVDSFLTVISQKTTDVLQFFNLVS
ncbi:hypothetical protein PMAYCL1PPCAC_26709 [Pristionchus mayeri]|uniref:Uda-1 n=1 Tax=Pristionchus mayeri TaxID=1317129 RepID=A0AAN5D6H5_9BILA|nr:hypothetical protein PMAYCL1PPCAC_26709 [Pristionchus mayeri]